MARLTERDECDYIHDEYGRAFTYSPIHFCGDCYIGEVIDKLADYEDAEEQGFKEIRNKVIDEFAERIKEHTRVVGSTTCEDLDEIAKQMKGE